MTEGGVRADGTLAATQANQAHNRIQLISPARVGVLNRLAGQGPDVLGRDFDCALLKVLGGRPEREVVVFGLSRRVGHNLAPGHLLARVGGDSPHYSGCARLGDRLSLVHGLALIDIIERIDLLLNMAARGLRQVCGNRGVAALGEVPAVGAALLIYEVVPGPVIAAVDLAAHRVYMHAVAVVVVDAEEVVHIARVASSAAAEANGAHGRAVAEPVGDVDVVDVLLDEVVAGERNPVLPGPYKVVAGFGVDRTRPEHVPDAVGDPAGVESAELLLDDDGLVRLAVLPVVAHLGAGGDDKALLLGELAGGYDSAAAGRIDRDGLLDEDVLTGVDGCLKVQRAEQRRSRHQDNLHIGLKQLAVAVGAAETSLRRDTELPASLDCPVRKVVGGGCNADVEAENLGCIERAGGGAPASTAAADKPDFERLACCCGPCAEDVRGAEGDARAQCGSYEITS